VLTDICATVSYSRGLAHLKTESRFGTGLKAAEKGFRYSTEEVHAWSTDQHIFVISCHPRYALVGLPTADFGSPIHNTTSEHMEVSMRPMYSEAACRGLSSTPLDLQCAAGLCWSFAQKGGVKLPCQPISSAVPHCRLVRGANKAITLVQMDTFHTIVAYMLHVHAASQSRGSPLI